jgi:hypothetical protein
MEDEERKMKEGRGRKDGKKMGDEGRMMKDGR